MHQVYLLPVSESLKFLHNTNPCLTSMRTEIIITVFMLASYCGRNQKGWHPLPASGRACPGWVPEHDRALPLSWCPAGRLWRGQEQGLGDLAGLLLASTRGSESARIRSESHSESMAPRLAALTASVCLRTTVHVPHPRHIFSPQLEVSPKSSRWELCRLNAKGCVQVRNCCFQSHRFCIST